MKPSSLVITAAHVFPPDCWTLELPATEMLLPSPTAPPATQQEEEDAGTGAGGGGATGGVSTLPTPEVEPRLGTQLVGPTNSLQ